MTTRRTEGGETSSGDEGNDRLDLSDMPRYSPPTADLRTMVQATLPDLMVLGLLTLLCYAFAVHRFARYDPR